MDTKKLRSILGWCSILNIGLYVFSMLCVLLAHDWMYECFNTFFTGSIESYNTIMIMSFGIWETLIIVFNVVPYFALRIVDRKAVKTK